MFFFALARPKQQQQQQQHLRTHTHTHTLYIYKFKKAPSLRPNLLPWGLEVILIFCLVSSRCGVLLCGFAYTFQLFLTVGSLTRKGCCFFILVKYLYFMFLDQYTHLQGFWGSEEDMSQDPPVVAWEVCKVHLGILTMPIERTLHCMGLHILVILISLSFCEYHFSVCCCNCKVHHAHESTSSIVFLGFCHPR